MSRLRSSGHRDCYYDMCKNGSMVKVHFKGSTKFRKTRVETPLAKERIFAVDTESLTKDGVLKTLLIPVHFHDSSEMIETPEGQGMLERFFDLLWRKGYAVEEPRASQTKQRSKRPRGKVLGRRDGDHKTIKPYVSIWFNFPYDFGRLVADISHDKLRTVIAGADGYKLDVSERFELEVRKMIFGNASSFDWRIREKSTRTIVRLVGIDLVGYWKMSLAKAAAATGAKEKIDIESQIDGVYEKPFESFSEAEWDLFKGYGLGDVETTLELYHSTVELLIKIDANVIRKTGLIPPSAPGAAIKIMTGHAFINHPEIDWWERYPAWCDQMGCDSYFGGRVFCSRPGRHVRMIIWDLKSAYPFILSNMPDPVTMVPRLVEPSVGFHVNEWRGQYGVLYVSGESTDDIYPAIRVHDMNLNGRLRYVYGKFRNLAVTIPELVIGVLRGVLRIDEIHTGCHMMGSPEKSFMRTSINAFFAVKEDPANDKAMRDTGKLMANSPYGKLIEVQSTSYLVAENFPMAHFKEKLKVCASIVHMFVMCGPNVGECRKLYWGDTKKQKAKAMQEYQREVDSFRGDPEEKGVHAVAWYTQALSLAEVETSKEGLCSVAQYTQGQRKYEAGRFFMPLYATQITGTTSAMLGLMGESMGAYQGDTDSVHIPLPDGVDDASLLPGRERYFRIMELAGYPSPRESKQLGSWEEESPGPSVESLLARTKVYSHKFADGTYKQAQHGIPKFYSPEIDAALKGRAFCWVESRELVHGQSRDERTQLAKDIRAPILHEAIRTLIDTGAFSYKTRPAPRKLREAIISGEQVGEFVSRDMCLTLRPDPNTWVDDEGIVHWNPTSDDPVTFGLLETNLEIEKS